MWIFPTSERDKCFHTENSVAVGEVYVSLLKVTLAMH